jgi:hypothetical protein
MKSIIFVLSAVIGIVFCIDGAIDNKNTSPSSQQHSKTLFNKQNLKCNNKTKTYHLSNRLCTRRNFKAKSTLIAYLL